MCGRTSCTAQLWNFQQTRVLTKFDINNVFTKNTALSLTIWIFFLRVRQIYLLRVFQCHCSHLVPRGPSETLPTPHRFFVTSFPWAMSTDQRLDHNTPRNPSRRRRQIPQQCRSCLKIITENSMQLNENVKMNKRIRIEKSIEILDQYKKQWVQPI
jgi:hypothetical protein